MQRFSGCQVVNKVARIIYGASCSASVAVQLLDKLKNVHYQPLLKTIKLIIKLENYIFIALDYNFLTIPPDLASLGSF